MWEHDMCLCASIECVKYHECLRGAGIKRQGIYTSSYLGETCNEESNYECYLQIEESNKIK